MPDDPTAFVLLSRRLESHEADGLGGLTPPAQGAGGFLVVHPAHRTWLAGCGIRSAADVIDLPGEVVCGHPDRHVVRVELATPTGRRVVYLKREHVVGWRVGLRNARAGYGWVSRAGREAACLQELERLGLPSPQFLAHGEDGHGRAFLLVDGLTEATELREFLRTSGRSPAERRELSIRLGRTVAELHDAGFETPDLSAKHVFVRPGNLEPTLIDWQSARRRRVVPVAARVRALATLTASLAGPLAGPRDRLRVLWAYRRSVRWPGGTPGFADLARQVAAAAAVVAGRSSLREQRLPPGGTPAQRLVWLTGGEAVCIRPEVAADWPSPPVCAPFYPAPGEPAPDSDPVPVWLANGEVALLVRFRSAAPPGWLAPITGRPWRSPGVALARVFFHLERHGVPVPRLLAFGQRRVGPFRGQSFVLYGDDGTTPATEYLRTPGPVGERRRMLFAVGAGLRAIHEAGCRLGPGAGVRELIRVAGDADTARVVFDPARGLRKVRAVRRAARVADLRTILGALLPPAARTDRLRVLIGYFAGDAAARTSVRAAARRLPGGRATQ